MKKKKTLSTQLTLVISFIVLLIVGVFWMANNTLLEKYYVFNKEKEMLAVYKMVDSAAKNDKLSDDTFALYAHGYAIERETLCREDRRRYVVLSVRGGAPKREIPLSECAVSPALLRAEGAADYLEQLYLREKKALDGMEQGASENKRLAYQRALVQCIQSAREELK